MFSKEAVGWLLVLKLDENFRKHQQSRWWKSPEANQKLLWKKYLKWNKQSLLFRQINIHKLCKTKIGQALGLTNLHTLRRNIILMSSNVSFKLPKLVKMFKNNCAPSLADFYLWIEKKYSLKKKQETIEQSCLVSVACNFWQRQSWGIFSGYLGTLWWFVVAVFVSLLVRTFDIINRSLHTDWKNQ